MVKKSDFSGRIGISVFAVLFIGLVTLNKRQNLLQISNKTHFMNSQNFNCLIIVNLKLCD